MMKKIFNKKVFSFLLTVLTLTVFMSAMVFATEAIDVYIKNLTKTIQTIAVAFIALAACTTAVLYMVGSVNPKLKDKGKDALYALIIGVIVLVFSNDIAAWIGDITKRENITNTTTTQSQSNINNNVDNGPVPHDNIYTGSESSSQGVGQTTQ